MANTFSLTAFVSKTGSQFLKQDSPLIALSYRGFTELDSAKTYAPSDTLNIKIPYYPTATTGLSVSAQDITDLTTPYIISDEDIYNVAYSLDIRELKFHVIGGKTAIVGNLSSKTIDPAAKYLIDNYSYPTATVLRAKIETVIAEKCRTAAFFTPIDEPSKLKVINSYSDISAITALEDNLGWISKRFCAMNVDDARSVADSLQNMFNESINEKITRTARIGGQARTMLAGQDFFQSNVISITPEAPQFSVNPIFTVGSISGDGSTITFAGVDTVTSVLFNAGSKISIPSVFLINQANKLSLATKLVICVAEDASGDGAGNCVVTLSEPLVAVGGQAFVDSLPANGVAAELFPAHTNNYCFNPQGIIANPLLLADIAGADNGSYVSSGENVAMNTYVQGVVDNGVNTFRASCLCATKAYARNLINLMGAIA